MSASDPAPAPAWASSMAIDFANKASGGNSIDLALLLASVREGALREAAGALTALAPNGAGYRRPEWERFDFDLPCADAIDKAFKVGSGAILSLLTTPPREATR